jgi:catechol 2,3-dioxygenase-like lactoylglutathione lyase family enzyme
MQYIQGIGGIFFTCRDVEETRAWYRAHLGIESEAWGAMFPWKSANDDGADRYTVWGPFRPDADYFAPSAQPFMINFIVRDLDALLAHLEQSGVPVLGRSEDDFGRFAWILDPNDVKLELWQPAEKTTE